jgi:hypothetical protein
VSKALKVGWFRLGMWKWDAVVLVGGTNAQVEAEIKRLGIEQPNVGEHSAGHAWVTYGKPCAIWVQTLRDIPCLVHEAFHLVHGVLEARGVKHSVDSEEAFAYTLEAFLRGILECKKWSTSKAR